MKKIKVTKVVEVPTERVVAIKTQDSTFISDGLYMHNCSACNMMHEMRPEIFTRWYVDKFGVEAYDNLVLDSQGIADFSRSDLEDIITPHLHQS